MRALIVTVITLISLTSVVRRAAAQDAEVPVVSLAAPTQSLVLTAPQPTVFPTRNDHTVPIVLAVVGTVAHVGLLVGGVTVSLSHFCVLSCSPHDPTAEIALYAGSGVSLLIAILGYSGLGTIRGIPVEPTAGLELGVDFQPVEGGGVLLLDGRF